MIEVSLFHSKWAPSREQSLRVMADAIMVNAALIIALLIHYAWKVGIAGGTTSAQAIFNSYVQAYLISFWLLTLICLVVFYLGGFYTHGRFYQNWYKVLVITQAVSMSYLLFSYIVFLFWEYIVLPRIILMPAWLLTVAFLTGTRAVLELWRREVQTKQDLKPIPSTNKARIIERNVLVIGGAGYIGSALLPKLLDRGYHVRLLDLLLYGMEPIADFLHHPRLEIVRADFRQVDKMVAASRNIETVVHLGAIVGDPACALDENLTIEVNLMATRMIAEVAKGTGVKRFVFASTCSVYGASDEFLDEHSSLNPVSLYARSKIASEHILMNMASERFSPTVLRFGTIYGLSGRTRLDLVVNLLAAKAVFDGEITVFGGDQWRPFMHVDDAANSIIKVLEAPMPLVRNQVFNVGSNEQNYRIIEVGEIISELIPSARLIQTEIPDVDRRNYRVNFNKIRRTVDFQPQWTIEQGISQVTQAIQNGKIVDYRNPEYSNVRFLNDNNNGASDVLRSQNGWAYELLNETLPEYEKLLAH